MKLRPLESADAIRNWQAASRDTGTRLTNLFPDERKIADWLRRRVTYAIEDIADCSLMVVHEGDFDRLFFMSQALDPVARACAAYQKDSATTCVLDMVGPKPIQDAAQKVFATAGFSVRKSLTRMQRRKGVESYNVTMPAFPRETTEGDALSIYADLHNFFDVRAEQLPSLEEVRLLCTNGTSFVADDGRGFHAFLLGEIKCKKGTVRYWFTKPDGRGKGYGGVLMHKFLDRCCERGASYQELWVLDDNENAIKRYQHYGFDFTPLKDTVFIKENT